MGIAILLIGIPLALVIRHRPEQYGLLPDSRLPEIGQPVFEQDNLATEVSFSLTPALRTKAFWMPTTAMGLFFWMRNIAGLKSLFWL